MRKSESLVKIHVRNQIQQDFRKQYAIEIGINLKSFCNNYHYFYHAGSFPQSLRLIRSKAIVGQISMGIPIPGKKDMRLDFSAMTQNDIKKGLGICSFKVGHTWDYSAFTTFKVIHTVLS